MGEHATLLARLPAEHQRKAIHGRQLVLPHDGDHGQQPHGAHLRHVQPDPEDEREADGREGTHPEREMERGGAREERRTGGDRRLQHAAVCQPRQAEGEAADREGIRETLQGGEGEIQPDMGADPARHLQHRPDEHAGGETGTLREDGGADDAQAGTDLPAGHPGDVRGTGHRPYPQEPVMAMPHRLRQGEQGCLLQPLKGHHHRADEGAIQHPLHGEGTGPRHHQTCLTGTFHEARHNGLLRR